MPSIFFCLRLQILICIFFMLLCSCSIDNSSKSSLTTISIAARGNGQAPRPIIYRIKAPKAWTYSQPSLNDSLTDTTLALCEFSIEEDGQSIRITIHNFPSDKIEERIPPKAQIARWKQQFQELSTASVIIKPQAYSGYTGLFFEGSGKFNGTLTTILGWSMQMGREHYQTLSVFDHSLYKQMRADVTIKAVGPTDLMQKKRQEIEQFARSFELINEIPTRQ
jgi:hypothetical protein